jgi:hypothetical protein
MGSQKKNTPITESSTHTSTAHISPTATRGCDYHGSLVILPLVYESSNSIKVQQSNISKSQFTSQMQKHHITCFHSHKSALRGELKHCTHTKKGNTILTTGDQEVMLCMKV